MFSICVPNLNKVRFPAKDFGKKIMFLLKKSIIRPRLCCFYGENAYFCTLKS